MELDERQLALSGDLCSTCRQFKGCLAPQGCRQPDTTKDVPGWVTDALIAVFLVAVVAMFTAAVWKGMT